MTAITEHLKHRVEQTRVALEKARARLAEARAQEESLTAELGAYERTYQAELRREGKAPTSQQQPLGKDFVGISNGSNKTEIGLAIIRAGGSHGVGPDDVSRGFKEHGHEINRNYVFNIVSRLKSQNKIEVRDGRYFAK